jgi:hypothetical protein
MCIIEEIKVRQRSRDRDILEGDRNTAYFYAIANHRARKKKIEGMQGERGLVQDTQIILNITSAWTVTSGIGRIWCRQKRM